MYDSAVPYGAVVVEDGGMIAVHVDDGVLLDVHLVADDDGRVVGADLGTGQHAGVAADGHVAQNDGRFGQKGVLSDHRLMPADFSYKRHI